MALSAIRRAGFALLGVVIVGLSGTAGVSTAFAAVHTGSAPAAQWQIAYSSSTLMTSFNSALALSPTDVWVVGNKQPPPGTDSPVVVRWNGSAWTSVPLPPAFGSAVPTAVAGTSAWNVWLFGYYSSGGRTRDFALRWNGSSWSLSRSWLANGEVINTAAVISRADVWIFGTIGTWHFNGTRWTESHLPYSFAGVSVVNGNDFWAVGSYTASGAPVLARRHDGAWTTAKLPSITSGPPGPALDGVLAYSDSDLWVVGGTVTAGGGVKPLGLHWSGGAWSTSAPMPGSDYLDGVVPDGAGGLWAAFAGPYDSTTVLHFTGGQWQTVTLPQEPSTSTSAPVLVRVPKTSTVYAAGISFWGGEPQTSALILKY